MAASKIDIQSDSDINTLVAIKMSEQGSSHWFGKFYFLLCDQLLQ